MLKHVVVPLDGSELSEQAIPYVESVLAPKGKITLISVIELPFDYDYPLVEAPLTVVTTRSYSEAEYDNAYKRVNDYLLGQARPLTAKGFEVECVAETGDPATKIVDVAGKHKADAIVMTTHGRTGFSRWLFGSVAQKVISMMPCPVMVVPGMVTERSEEAKPTTAAATS